MKEFYVVLVTIALINCISLSRITGPACWLGRPGEWRPSSGNPGVATVFALATAALLVVSAGFSAGALALAAAVSDLSAPPLLIVALSISVTTLLLLPLTTWIHRRYPLSYLRLRFLLPVAGVETAILTSLVILSQTGTQVMASLLWSLCAAAGTLMMTAIFAGMRLRLAVSGAPDAWRGLPLELVAAGILAMALLSPIGAMI